MSLPKFAEFAEFAGKCGFKSAKLLTAYSMYMYSLSQKDEVLMGIGLRGLVWA